MKELSILIFCILFAACVPKQDMIEKNPFLIEKGSRPMVIGHGGAKKLFPENTMLAFEGAFEIGLDVLEMDLVLTKDDILVTHHDLTLERMSDGTGALMYYDYEELLEWNYGDGFEDINGNFPYQDSMVMLPKLEEVFDRFGNFYYNIEIKNRGDRGKKAAEVLKTLIEDYNLQKKVLVASFDDEALMHFREITNDEVLISTSEKESRDFAYTGLSGMEYLYSPDAAVVQLPANAGIIPLDVKRMVRSAHRRNMAIHYWTINDKASMRKLIEHGVDGIITDRPDIMNELLLEMGF